MIDRLKEYIEKDEIYQANKKGELINTSDFDKFCIQHCKDIEELLEENEKLKKQLEEYKEELMIATKMEIKQIDETTFLGIDYFQDKCIMFKTQQQEFIKYLEDEINACKVVSDLLFNSNKEIKVYKEILQKYKSIIRSIR